MTKGLGRPGNTADSYCGCVEYLLHASQIFLELLFLKLPLESADRDHTVRDECNMELCLQGGFVYKDHLVVIKAYRRLP